MFSHYPWVAPCQLKENNHNSFANGLEVKKGDMLLTVICILGSGSSVYVAESED